MSPVTVASNERTFSKLKFVKNLLRTTMSENRLCALMFLAAEKDLVDKLDIDAVVSRRSELKNRRIRLKGVNVLIVGGLLCLYSILLRS